MIESLIKTKKGLRFLRAVGKVMKEKVANGECFYLDGKNRVEGSIYCAKHRVKSKVIDMTVKLCKDCISDCVKSHTLRVGDIVVKPEECGCFGKPKRPTEALYGSDLND